MPSPGTSITITGVRFSSRTTSTVSPGMGCFLHQASTSATARSMWPASRQPGSNAGDLLGMRMYSERAGTISFSQTPSENETASALRKGEGICAT
ncbi:MAG: hypothetical protein NVSMB23_10860 [Myxococcales bacterium]